MSSPPTFFSEVLATAKQASAQTGVLPSVILAQWAIETAYGGGTNFTVQNNYAGVSAGGYVNGFPSKAAGLAAYISNLKSSYYVEVRTAKTWQSQAKALGESQWAASHYDTPTTGGYPGSQLIAVITENQLVRYDAGASAGSSSGAPLPPETLGIGSVTGNSNAGFVAAQTAFFKAYGTVAPPPKGFESTAASGEIVVNGSMLTELVGEALITVQETLSITKASTITLTIHDPTRRIVRTPIWSQQSTLTFGTWTWVLQGIEKDGSVLTITFIPWVVYALEQATGAFTVHPGQMTRTDFARLLVSQIDGATFWQATEAYLSSLKAGYAHTAREQLSRGTWGNPLENSWTCLQRLASEIQWVCFEVFGKVYFGPYSFLAQQDPSLAAQEFKDGVTTITGTYTTAQPLGQLTIAGVAGDWVPTPGDAVAADALGPFSIGNWIVSELDRENVEEPTVTVTCIQPQPGLPEPISGGTRPAVGSGAGDIQTTGGRRNAAKALAFCVSKVGHPYSETTRLRLGPEYYDCSGLVYEAYLSVGISIGTTTFTQWPNGAGAKVPPGINNLLPGDLLYFGYLPFSAHETAQHVAIVKSVTAKRGTVTVVEAADPAQGVIETSNVNPTVGVTYGTLVYLGAMRPSP